MTTPVIFRKLPTGAIMALFPTLPVEGNSLDSACQGFVNGALCETDTGIMRATKEARADDFVQLIVDMAKAGLNVADLKIVKRIKQHLNDERIMTILETEAARKQSAA